MKRNETLSGRSYPTGIERSNGIDRRVSTRRARLLSIGWRNIAPNSFHTGMLGPLPGQEVLYTTLAYADTETFWRIVASKRR